MSDIKLSGYKATAASVVWTSPTQDFNGLADGEWCSLSDEIDNSSNLYAYADLEIVLGSAAFTGADSQLEVFLVPSVDGSNYPDWTDNVTSDEQENEQYFVGAVTTSGATSAQRLVLRDVELPNGKYKYGLRNQTGVALAGSGNTLKWRPHQVQTA